MSHYKTAQVCLNGHTTTSSVETSPEMTSKYCKECGAENITKCPECDEKIRGFYSVEGVISIREYHPPSFCHGCGSMFPWTQIALDAAKELAEELDGLTPDEREIVQESITDLVRDSPRTEVAAVRLKRLLRKTGGGAASAMKNIIVSVATEAAKKALLGE